MHEIRRWDTGEVLFSGPGQPRQVVQDAVNAGVCLHRADLRGLYLYGVNFNGADLSEAMMDNADIESCTFEGANINNVRRDGRNDKPIPVQATKESSADPDMP